MRESAVLARGDPPDEPLANRELTMSRYVLGMPLYVPAGLPEVWLVDLGGECIEMLISTGEVRHFNLESGVTRQGNHGSMRNRFISARRASTVASGRRPRVRRMRRRSRAMSLPILTIEGFKRPPAAWISGESGTSPGNRLGGRIEVMAATRQSPVT